MIMAGIIDQNEHIFKQQINQLYRYPVLRLFALFIISLCMTLLVAEKFPFNQIMIWLSVVFIILCLRIMLEYGYKRLDTRYTSKKWAILMAIASTTTGCCLGSAAYLIHTIDAIGIEIGIAMLVLGYTLIASTTLFPYPLAYYGLLITTFIPFIILFLSKNTTIGYTLGFSCCAYVIMASSFARANYFMLLESIRLRLELEKQSKAAVEANLSKSKFLAAASHDLRQPLHALSLFVGVLENRIKKKAKTLSINNIKNTVVKLEEMFNALLDITKLDAKVTEANQKHVRLDAIVNNFSEEFKFIAHKNNLLWQTDDCHYFVNTDPILLERILRNLISNAFQFTQHGSVILSCTSKNNEVLLAISDTGIGIPVELQDEIFREFYQVQNTQHDRIKGFGLGLSIVGRLCELLDIAINVESEIGKGTKFTIPLQKGCELEPVENDDIENKYARTQFNNELVVVLDDEIEIDRSISVLLEQWGCNVISGNDTDSVLQQLATVSKPPCLIITDYWLRGGQTGLDAIRKIESKINRTVPVLIITGDSLVSNSEDVNNCHYMVLLKPVQPARLRVFIRNTITNN